MVCLGSKTPRFRVTSWIYHNDYLVTGLKLRETVNCPFRFMLEDTDLNLDLVARGSECIRIVNPAVRVDLFAFEFLAVVD